MNDSRRRFLTGMAGILAAGAAPAILAQGVAMPIRARSTIDIAGHTYVAVGESAGLLIALRPVPFDELDYWPADNMYEGDPVSLATRRARAFTEKAKIWTSASNDFAGGEWVRTGLLKSTNEGNQ